MVTVVLSTYNRSKVLEHAIKSVLWQSYEDFELLVIGDCCTDDSEQVARSFMDHRIRWINLPSNCGNQYGPNNYGLEIAKGDYIAYHNHDDIWYPTHLEDLVNVLDTKLCDVAHSLGRVGDQLVGLYSGDFDHDKVCLASNIIMHTAKIGVEWSNPWTISLPVDQDFIRKLVNIGARFLCTKKLTSLKFPAIAEDRYYEQVDDYDWKQKEIVRKIESNPAFIQEQLVELIYSFVDRHGDLTVGFNNNWKTAPKGEFVQASREKRGLSERF